MKSTLTILFLFIAALSKSQDTPIAAHMAIVYYNWELPHTKDFDTIPAVMMVTNDNTGATSTQGYFDPLDQATNDRRIPFWVKGYRVNKYVFGGWSNDIYLPAHWEHYEYLDENKKQLQFRVWMVQ